jgi:hypothetical protein
VSVSPRNGYLCSWGQPVVHCAWKNSSSVQIRPAISIPTRVQQVVPSTLRSEHPIITEEEGRTAMQITNDSITFGPIKGSGPRSDFKDVTFSGAVSQATAIMTGMSVEFSPSDGDHHLGNLTVRLNSAVNGSTVRVTATYGLEDWSGNWDDSYDGEIFFAVIAE